MNNFYTNFKKNACSQSPVSGILIFFLLLSAGLQAQVATKYSFSSTLGNYVPITGGHLLASDSDPITGGSVDDDAYFLEPIGFQFYYNGNSFNQFWVNTNGFIKLGDITTPPSSTYYFGPPLSLNPNCISALANDLMGQGFTRSSSLLRVEVLGIAPFRTCVVQFSDWSAYPGSNVTANERYNFQIRLNENDGNSFIEIIYGGNATTGAGGWTQPANAVQVGISGSTVTDYNSRVGTWASSTAGLNNTAGMTFTNAVVPDSGRTFKWSIAPEAMVIDSYSTVGVTAGAITGSNDNAVVAGVVYTHGDSARQVISQLNFNMTGTTNTADVVAAKVWYSGTNPQFDPAISTQFGSTTFSPNGSLIFSGVETLNPGANYFWLTYDLSLAAPSGNLIDGQCTNITYGFTNNNTPNVTSPAGARRLISPMSGNYTINPAGAGSTNFVNFDSALSSLYINGVSGPVKFTVSAGTYNLSSGLRINAIPAITATNNVVFEGVNKNTTILTGSLSSLPLVTINAKYITLRNLTITNTATGSCSGVVLLGSSTLNTGSGCRINNCIINLPNLGTSTGTSVAMTTDPSGNSFNASVLMDSVLIDSNVFNTAYYGVGIYGALNISFNKGIKIRNNVLTDIYQYGFYMFYVMNSLEILNNDITNRASGYGVYLNRCEGSNSSHLISGNKIRNFSAYGIYHFSGTSSLPMVSRIYNNLVISPASSVQNCIYVSLLAPSPIEVYHNTAIFNFATTTNTYGPFYSGGSPNIKVKNNIFINNAATGGTNPAAYISTSPTGNDVNYNIYYNRNLANKNMIYRGGVIYVDSTYKTATAGGDSSFRILPPFDSEFKLTNPCSPKSTLDLTAIVPVDIEGQARSTTPYIGCDETVSMLNDIGIDSLLSPKSPITGGPNDMVVRIRNFGSNMIYSFNVNYIHNSAPVVTQYATPLLNSCDTVSVLFTGPQQINLTGTNSIKVYTSSPNGGADDLATNDTIVSNLFGPLSGTYTVGGTSPSFATIVEAASALQASGVSGPVTFNVAPGTYTGQVTLNGTTIPGLSPSTPILFQGAGAATTIITANISQQATVLINQCNNVTFRDFTINNTNGANPIGVAIVGNATLSNNGSGSMVKKCIINVVNAGTAVSYGISVTSSAGGYGTTATWANDVQIDSNTVNGAYYGIVFYGRQDSSCNKNIKFRNNVVNAFYYGMFIYYIYNPIDVLNNTVSLFTPSASATPWGYHGIYMTANTTYDPLVPSRISNNTITGFQNYGIYMTNIGAAGSALVKIYNNLVTSATYNCIRSINISSTTGGAEIYHNTFVFNANSVTQSYGAGYFTGAFLNTSLIKNNIFANTNALGLNTPLYLATNPPAGSVDYNVYFNRANTNLVFRSVYYTTANYNTATAGGLNSFNAEPVFANLSGKNAHLAIGCSPKGVNLNASVPTDVDGDTRNNPPQIGADEFVPVSLDVLTEAITQPVFPIATGAQNLVVTIRNNGTTTVTALNVAYKLNAAAPVVQAWTGSLAPCATATVTFTGAQQINIPAGVSNLTVYTYAPNGGTDGRAANDTLNAVIGAPMAGAYVIGTAPSDYTTFTGAVNDLKVRGVSGAVTFNVKAGTYTEQVIVPPIQGASLTNTITFKSQTNNRNDVTLTFNSITAADNYIMRLWGSFVNLKSMTLNAPNVTYGHVIEVVATAASDTVMDCNIISAASASTSTDRANIFSNPMLGNKNVFLNNTITNGAYSFYLYGLSATALTDGVVIDGNISQNAYYYNILVSYMNNIKIRNNSVTAGNYGYGYGIYPQYCDNNMEITGNTIAMPIGGYALYLYDCDGSSTTGAIVKNNVITVGGASAGYGIMDYYGSYKKIINNTVNITSTATGTYAGYFYWSNSVNDYNLVYNNILVNSSIGFATYAYSPIVGVNNRWDYNFLNTAGVNLAATGTPALNYPTLASWRTAMGQEKNTLAGRAPFISASNLAINLSDTNAWLLNGNGIQVAGNTTDKNGNARSTTMVGGAPDIGAFEMTPTSLPPLAVAIPATPAPGTTQVFMNGIDTVAKITWDPFASAPTSITGRLYSGAYGPSVSPLGSHALNAYWNFDAPASFYGYSISLYYRNSWLGSIPHDSLMIGAKKSGTNPWNTYASPQSSVDTAANILTITSLTDFSDFTGTTGSNPVPVKLSAFKATAVGRDVLVYWTTASERNAAYFIVEASTDGRTYTSAGRVAAKGTSSVSNNYSLSHSNAQVAMGGAAVIYYRLTTVDRDGSKEQSDVVMVNFNNKRGQLETAVAYPNPFSSTVKLAVPAVGDDKLTLQVTDIRGRVIGTSTEMLVQGMNEISLNNLGALERGVYFIKATTGNGEAKVIKVVKE